MGDVMGRLTVLFEEPFWVGIVEHIEDGMLSVSKVVFGAEPKEYEVYAFVLSQYDRLLFSPAVTAEVQTKKKNPKRIQRDVKRQCQNIGIGTKSQQALKLQQEQNKQVRREKRREQKLEKAERMFAQKQQKKKEKHRGH